jgi:hypothetical protein
MSATLPSDCHPRLLEGFTYWRARHTPDGRLPGRQSIDPIDLKAVLPAICLYEVHRDAPHDVLRFRYRVIGTQVAARMERDYTGCWLEEVHPKFVGSAAYGEFVEVARGVLPFAYYHGLPLFHTNKDYAAIERVLLPLARDGVNVDMMLAIMNFETTDPGA